MFKHGIINNPAKPLEIKIAVEENKLHMETCNFINTAGKDEASGVGLVNVRKRLDLMYAGNYDLKETVTNGKYCNELILNLSK